MFEKHVIITGYVLFLNIFIALSLASFIKIAQDFITRKNYWYQKLIKFLGSGEIKYGSI
jgi:hypothetical protein